MLTSKDPRLAGRVAFHYPNFVSYTFARFFIVVALEMQSVAVAWQVYEITRRPLDLGYVGLAQFAPGFVLFLFAGHAADVLDRRKLLMWCYAGFGLCSALLLAISWRAPHSVHAIYVVLVLLGVFRSFSFPVSRALLPQLVPEEHFSNAVAWNASTFQIATIAGPAIGGIAYAAFHGPHAVYALAVTVSVISSALTFRIRPLPASREKQLAEKAPISLRTVLAGFRFIWDKKLILGSISLDMFAVLLGGAVALLPVYAREILHTGPWGLGLLRSAPGVGAALMAIVVAHRPIRRRSGLTMLFAVAAFGVTTIIFGLSHSLSGDSRRNARPSERGGHDVHRSFERIGRIRVGADRPMVRDGSGGGVGRGWHAADYRDLGVVVSGVKAGGSAHGRRTHAEVGRLETV